MHSRSTRLSTRDDDAYRVIKKHCRTRILIFINLLERGNNNTMLSSECGSTRLSAADPKGYAGNTKGLVETATMLSAEETSNIVLSHCLTSARGLITCDWFLIY